MSLQNRFFSTRSFIILFIIHCRIILKELVFATQRQALIETEFNLCESILNSILRKLMTERLKLLSTKIVPTLCEEPQFINKYQVPRIEKIVINRGLGDVAKCKNTQSSLDELSIIAGQRGVLT
jgi:hypothetical protein